MPVGEATVKFVWVVRFWLSKLCLPTSLLLFFREWGFVCILDGSESSPK